MSRWRGSSSRQGRDQLSQFPEGSCSLCHPPPKKKPLRQRYHCLNSPKGPALFVTPRVRGPGLRGSRALSQFPEGSCSLCHEVGTERRINGPICLNSPKGPALFVTPRWSSVATATRTCLNSPKGPALFVTHVEHKRERTLDHLVSIPRRVLLSLSQVISVLTGVDLNDVVSIPRRVLLSLSLNRLTIRVDGEMSQFPEGSCSLCHTARPTWTEMACRTCLNSPKGPALFVTQRRSDVAHQGRDLVSIPRRVLLSLSPNDC